MFFTEDMIGRRGQELARGPAGAVTGTCVRPSLALTRTGGTARRGASRGARFRAGFTLAELVIVVVLIGLISAIVVPKFTTTRERAYSAALRADLRSLQSSLDVFRSQYGRYTANVDSLEYRASPGVQTFLRVQGAEWEAVALMEGPPLRLCRVSSRDQEMRCDQTAIPRPVSRLDSLVAELPWAATALRGPSAMHVGESRTVTLVLDPSYEPSATADTVVLPEAVRDSLRATLVGGDSSEVVDFKPVRRSARMLARLEGTGFEIDPPPSADGRLTQGVLAARPTEWQWTVKALAAGSQTLQVSLYALVNLEGETPVRFQVLRRNIKVTVTWREYIAGFLSRHWIWLLMLLLAPPPLIVWLVKKMKGAKRREPPTWEVP